MSAIPLYLIRKGEIRRQQNTIAILGEGRPVFKPISGILSLYIYGRYKLNTSAVGFLDDNYVPVHIFHRSGMYRGTFYNPPIPSSEVFVKQIEYFQDRAKYKVFVSVLRDAYREMLTLSCSYDVNDGILRYFKGLLFATLVDGIYMTHLDPTAFPSNKGVSMALVYALFGVYAPVLSCVAYEFSLKHKVLPSDWYECGGYPCLRADALKSLLLYWEKIMSSPIVFRWGKGPRRMLFRNEFWKIEHMIMWGEPYTPFVGLWHIVGGV